MAADRSAPVKKGILMVAFGSQSPQAQTAYQLVEARVKAVLPDMPMRWAYTSAVMRKIMAGKDRPVDSVEMALSRMLDDGITHAAVQSLHVIAGKEHHDLAVNCRLFSRMHGGFRQVMVGLPLLGTGKDMEIVATVLVSAFTGNRKPGQAVIFMGHGSAHPANACYTALMYHLQLKADAIFVGTMSGAPGIFEICQMLRKKKITSALLLPLLAVVGKHTLQDMAGDHETSWKSVLEKHGIACHPVLKGLAEYDALVDIWAGHLKTMVNAFS